MQSLIVNSLVAWLQSLVTSTANTLGVGGIVALLAGSMLLLSLSARMLKMLTSRRGMAVTAAVMLVAAIVFWLNWPATQQTPVAGKTEFSQPEPAAPQTAEPPPKPEMPFELPKLADLLDFGDEEETEEEEEELPLKRKARGRRSPIDELLTYGFPVIWVDPKVMPLPTQPPMPLLPHAGGFGNVRPFTNFLPTTPPASLASGTGTVLRYPSLELATSPIPRSTGSTVSQSTPAPASAPRPAVTVASAANSTTSPAPSPVPNSSTANAAARSKTGTSTQPPAPQAAAKTPAKGKPLQSGLPATAAATVTKAQQPASGKSAVSTKSQPRATGSAPRNQSQAQASTGHIGSTPTTAQQKATQRSQARAAQAQQLHQMDVMMNHWMNQMHGQNMGAHPGMQANGGQHPNGSQHPAGGQHHGAVPGGIHHNGAHH